MKQVFRERECIHREEGAEGEFYNGVFYVQGLQRLPVDRDMPGLTHQIFWYGCVPGVRLSFIWASRHAPSRKSRGAKPKKEAKISLNNEPRLLVAFCCKVDADEEPAT